ncbi:MAG: hypothetical protein IBJ18_08850 [Phycisphaerales bacterium]|nr:hypothetical protein [Phycisphaerales bacterium]
MGDVKVWTPRRMYVLVRRLAVVFTLACAVPMGLLMAGGSRITTQGDLVFVGTKPDGSFIALDEGRTREALASVSVGYSAQTRLWPFFTLWSARVEYAKVGNMGLIGPEPRSEDHPAILTAAAEGLSRKLQARLDLPSDAKVPAEALLNPIGNTFGNGAWLVNAGPTLGPTLMLMVGAGLITSILMSRRIKKLDHGHGCRHCGHGEYRWKGLMCTECGCDTAVV